MTTTMEREARAQEKALDLQREATAAARRGDFDAVRRLHQMVDLLALRLKVEKEER